ncbi:hypothetical protein ACH4S8_04925 [Streptomyces sp. NPDC021080]|uniref:hypothetical protein n=1 Tax=Streptomyces sp. NPDC021080 TaxID=3365110 RepID=UPI0037A5AD9A
MADGSYSSQAEPYAQEDGYFLEWRTYSKRLASQSVDWENRNYSITCDDIVDKPVKVNLRNGKGVAKGGGIGGYDRWEVAVQRTVRGKLPGLGDVTAVLIYCSPQPSNFFRQELRLYRADGREIGRVPTFDVPELPPQFQPKTLAIKSGRIGADVIFYGPEDTHASGPSIRRHVTWTWDGRRFVAHGANPASRRVDLTHSSVTVNGMGPLRIGMSRDEAEKAIGVPIPEGRRDTGRHCTDHVVQGGPKGLYLRFAYKRLVAIYVAQPAKTISTASGIHIGSTRDNVLNTYDGEITANTDYGNEKLVFAPVAPKFAGRVIVFDIVDDAVTSFIAGEPDFATGSCGAAD